MKFSTAAFLLSTAFTVTAGDHDMEGFGWGELDASLPKPLSDHTASAGPNGMIYIAGGCDAEDGNVYVSIDANEGFFACGSISSSLYSFDPNTNSFEELQGLPRPRYRHSSSIVGNQVWLVGGRTIEDSLIPEIDVYDIGTDSWSTAVLPEQYQVSDHAGFAQDPQYIYIAGGYDQNYTALDFLTRIDANTLDEASLGIEPQTPLITARGDIIGVTASDGRSAFISGGFTHANGFCAPLGSSEEYIFADNEWNSLPSLVRERGEVVLVEIDDHLYALGGERQIEGYCDGAGEGLDPGEQTVATDEVEIYDPANDVWEIIAGFPNHKFRFAAAVGPDGTIYAFGGQTAHDTACQCFKTTDSIAVFGEGFGSGASIVNSFMLLTVVVVATFVAL